MATSLLSAHGAAASTEGGDARVALPLLVAGIAFVVVIATLGGARREGAAHAAASTPTQRLVPLKRAAVATAPRRGEALLHVAMLAAAADTPRRRGVRQRRPGAVCACGGPPC